MSSAMISLLAAAAPAGDAPPAWMQFLPLVGLAVVFWFFILRPQMKQQKEHRQKIESIKKGDQVLTGGGILAKVISIDEHYANIEIAPSVRVKVAKSTISEVVDQKGVPVAND